MNIGTMLFLALLKIKTFLAFALSIVMIFWFHPEIHNNTDQNHIIYLITFFSIYILFFEKLNNKLNFSIYIATAIKESLTLIAIGYLLEFVFGFPHSSYPILVFSFLLFIDTFLYFFLKYIISSIKSSKIKVNKLVIIGNGYYKKELKRFIQNYPFSGYDIAGEINIDYDSPQDSLNQLTDILEKKEVHELVIIDDFSKPSEAYQLLKIADKYGLRLRMVPDFSDFVDASELGLSRIGKVPVINLRVIPLDRLKNKILKRSLDLILSTVFITLFMPFMILIAIGILIDSGGPVLYIPERVGKNGKIFGCLKFRTMYPSDSDQSTSRNDTRITRVGKLLRRMSLDELPQLFNIFIGQMSIAGPRPHRISLNKEFQDSVNGYMIRHYVKPGLTGWAQIHNLRGPTTTMDQKLQRKEHDIWYILNWSFALDLKIILLTIIRLPFQSNAF